MDALETSDLKQPELAWYQKLRLGPLFLQIRSYVRRVQLVEKENEPGHSCTESVWQELLHFICIRPASVATMEDKEKYFQWRLSQAAEFISRFDGRIDFSEKSILDFGCGFGSMSFFLAQKGARRVVGTDLDEERMAFARNKLASEFCDFCGRIEFTLPGELKKERFDLVISEDCFEHYDDPLAVMRSLRPLLAAEGRVVIGFSPLWKSPYGGHIGYMTKVPWAHLLFPERIIMRERRRYRPDENARTFSEMRGGLNKMTHSKFLETMEASGYQIEFLATNVSKSKMAPLINLIRRLPFCFEYLTKNLYAIVSPNRVS